MGALPHVPTPPQPEYRVTYLSHTTPASMTPGQRLAVTLRLRNDGNTVWQADGAHPVRLGQRWLPGGQEGPRTPLPRSVAPGETVTILAQVTAPAMPGNFTLRWDLIEEDTGWFSAMGAAPLDVAVRIQAAPLPDRPWTVSASDNTADAAKAIDADPQSAWSSVQIQRPGMWFLIDLGRSQQVSSLAMVSPAKDFPRGFVVETSTGEASAGGLTWSEIARKDANWKSIDLAFAPVRARLLRVTQTATPRWPVPWSISDITITATPLWSATASPQPGDAAKAIDGNAQSAWSTLAPQQPGAWFQLDLGDKTYVDRLRLDNSANPQYPRGYVVRASLDGQTWDEVARSASNWAPLDVALGPRWARFLRIECTRGSQWHPWTITEVIVTTAVPPA